MIMVHTNTVTIILISQKENMVSLKTKHVEANFYCSKIYLHIITNGYSKFYSGEK